MNLETICIICLKKGTSLKDIFTWTENVMEKMCQLSSMINACTELPLTGTAALPKTMCRDCIENLLIAYKFRLQCENAYKHFTEMYPTQLGEIKIENNSDDLKSKDNFDQLFEKNEEYPEVKLESSLDVFEDRKLDLNSLIKNDECNDETYDDFCLYPEQTYTDKRKKNNRKKAGESKKVKSKYESKKRKGGKIERINQWPCTICIKTFRYQHSLLRHLDSHYALKSYYCERCKKYYRNEKNHKAMHRRGAKFKCEVCNRRCKSKSMLEKHSEIHSTKREKFICDVESCKKIFLTVQGATRHKLIHSGAKEFLCHFCSKAFAEKAGLELHIRRHLNIKQYQCRMCTRLFLTSSHRIQHERRHTNTRNYSCQYCAKMFFTGSNLRRHLLSHTKEQNHNCRFCPKKFSRRDNKRRHEMVMHGVSDETDLPVAQHC